MSPLATEEFGPRTIDDLVGLLASEKISYGRDRNVYASHVFPDAVVKVENRGDNHFSNVLEWLIWQEFEGTKWEKWLAPCRWISASGIVLIQAKCEPLPLERRPRRVPAWMADLKGENWGLYKGRPVCFDYANNRLFEIARGKEVGLVAPRWHDLDSDGGQMRKVAT